MALVAAATRGVDFLETLDGSGGVVVWRHRRHFGLYCRQAAGGAAITARDGAGALACIGGLYDLGPGEAEAWFLPGPAFRPNRVGAMRALKRCFELIAQEAAPLRVTAYVRPDGVAGARLATWLGFADEGEAETGLGTMRRFVRRFD